MHEALKQLEADGLIAHPVKRGNWEITPKGRDALQGLDYREQADREKWLCFLYLISLGTGMFEGKIRLLRLASIIHARSGRDPDTEELERILDELIREGHVLTRSVKTHYGSSATAFQLSDSGRLLLNESIRRDRLSKMMMAWVEETYKEYGKLSIPEFELAMRQNFPRNVQMKIEVAMSLIEPKKVAIGTTNQAKVLATEQVLRNELGWKKVEILPIEIEGGVAQPTAELEAIRLAERQARLAQKKCGAEYGIGVQGTVQVIGNHGMFVGGWAAVLGPESGLGLGSSGLVQVPRAWQQRIEKGEELGDIVDGLVRKQLGGIEYEYRSSIGANGYLTKNLYHRVEEFRDAVRCAFARFISPEQYS